MNTLKPTEQVSDNLKQELTRKDIKLRLDSTFVKELDMIAKRLSLTRNGLISMLIHEGMVHSNFVNGPQKRIEFMRNYEQRNEGCETE